MIKKPTPCPYEHRCDHKHMSLVICYEENLQPFEKCYLYTLMKYIEDKKRKK